MTDNQRIEQLKKHLGLSANALSKELGLVSPQIFYDIKAGKCGISKDLAIKIQEHYLNISTAWLVTGEGKMLKSNNSLEPNVSVSTSTKGDKIASLKKIISEIQLNGKKRDKIYFIPLMNIDAVGGSGNDICDTSEYIEELIPVTGARDSSICLPVSGDSMMPIFNPGDLVVIDEVVEWTLFLEMGQYYVIALKDNRRLIKKITYSEEDKMQKFLLVSENPKYPPVELPKSLIHRIFIVTQKHQKLTL